MTGPPPEPCAAASAMLDDTTAEASTSPDSAAARDRRFMTLLLKMGDPKLPHGGWGRQGRPCWPFRRGRAGDECVAGRRNYWSAIPWPWRRCRPPARHGSGHHAPMSEAGAVEDPPPGTPYPGEEVFAAEHPIRHVFVAAPGASRLALVFSGFERAHRPRYNYIE